MHNWYGLQFISFSETGVFSEGIRFNGSLEETANHKLNPPTIVSNSGSMTCNEMLLIGPKHQVSIKIDPTYDLGTGKFNNTSYNAFTTNYGKVYFNIIRGNNYLKEGSCYQLKGSYQFMSR